MARPKSNEKRGAILDGAIRLISRDGLGTATAAIAKEAGVPNGSFFTYFPTKDDLYNELYLEIKEELINAVSADVVGRKSSREALLHLWVQWTRWGVNNPQKRRVLALLSVSDHLRARTRTEGLESAGDSLDLIQRVARQGPLRGVDPIFVNAIIENLAATTMEYMSKNPAQAEQMCNAAFEFLWAGLN